MCSYLNVNFTKLVEQYNVNSKSMKQVKEHQVFQDVTPRHMHVCQHSEGHSVCNFRDRESK